jgi:hypothetical protein
MKLTQYGEKHFAVLGRRTLKVGATLVDALVFHLNTKKLILNWGNKNTIGCFFSSASAFNPFASNHPFSFTSLLTRGMAVSCPEQ